MPLHDFVCPEGHKFAKFQRLDRLKETETCECGATAEKRFFHAPMGFVQADICYDSPVDGKPITNKYARIEDLRRNDCVEYEPSMRQHNARRRAQEEQKFDKMLDRTLDAEIAALPARKKELLEQEVRAGAAAEFSRPEGIA